MKDRKSSRTPNRDRKPADSGWGVILSIFVVIGGLFFVIPYLFTKIHNGILLGINVLLLIPLIRVITEYLQREQEYDDPLQTLVRQYLVMLFSLVFQLVFLLIMLPFIFIAPAAVLGGMFLLVLLVGILLYVAQVYLGIQIGRTLDYRDLQEIMRVFAYLLPAEVVAVGFLWIGAKYKDRFFDFLAKVHDTCIDKITTLV